jgi:hypothetical protein
MAVLTSDDACSCWEVWKSSSQCSEVGRILRTVKLAKLLRRDLEDYVFELGLDRSRAMVRVVGDSESDACHSQEASHMDILYMTETVTSTILVEPSTTAAAITEMIAMQAPIFIR